MVAESGRQRRPAWRPSALEPALARHLVLAVGAWWVWAMAEVSVVLFVVYPHSFTPWGAVAAQVIAYAVLIAPVLLLRSPLQPRVSRSRWSLNLAVGGAVLVAAIAVVASAHTPGFTTRQVVKLTATGPSEEILWRGAIWTSLNRATSRPAAVVALDVMLFVTWHIPSVLAGDNTWSGLPAVAALGVVFCLTRLASRRIELPALLHIAADLVGT
jgi:membrane protease YdiL (CAAX protease family)